MYKFIKIKRYSCWRLTFISIILRDHVMSLYWKHRVLKWGTQLRYLFEWLSEPMTRSFFGQLQLLSNLSYCLLFKKGYRSICIFLIWSSSGIDVIKKDLLVLLWNIESTCIYWYYLKRKLSRVELEARSIKFLKQTKTYVSETAK